LATYETNRILLEDEDEEWYNTHATSVNFESIPFFHHLSSVVDISLDLDFYLHIQV
jgi:hypothetical protein